MGQYEGWLWSPWDEECLKDCECWILDAKEFVPALNPFELWLQMPSGVRNMPYAAEFLSIPVALPAWRFKDGFCYLGRIKFSEKERELRGQH